MATTGASPGLSRSGTAAMASHGRALCRVQPIRKPIRSRHDGRACNSGLDDICELVTIGTVRHEAASLTSATHEDLFHRRDVMRSADSRQHRLCSESIGHIDVTLRAK